MTSALPKAVQKQIATANKIIEDMKKPSTPPTDTGTPPATPPTDTGTPPATPPTDTGTPPPATPPAQPPATPPAGDDTWQHKYQVLQGKYNAEVPRLKQQLDTQVEENRSLKQRMANLETHVATLTATRTPPATPPPAAPVKPKDILSPQEIETYGADLVEVITRVATAKAEEIAEARMKPVAGRVEKVEQTTSQVSQTVAQSKQNETLALLANAVPNWKQLDSDAGFLEWLDQVDPYSGLKRGVLLRRAFAANNADSVIAFFKGYLTENAAVTPEPSTPTPPATPPREPQARMEDLVAPGAPKAPTASAPNEAGKRVWTQQEVAQLYRRKNEFIRTHPGKPIPDDLDKLERDLFKAQKEGRLR